MRSREFAKLAELVPDGLVMVDASGRILEANRTARAVIQVGDADLTTLQACTANSPESIADFLHLCRRSRDEIVGALRLNPGDSPTRIFGRLISRGDTDEDTFVLLRIPDEDSGINRFAVLNQKVDELGREIARRRALEAQLTEQRDLAAFGRDIGIALAESADLDASLGRCAEHMVEQLGGAFARIWVLEPSRNELILRASAGLYTHLDGPHSRIRVGEYKIGMIAQESRPHLTNSVIGDPRVHNQEWAQQQGMVAFAGYPLMVDGSTVGVMAMFARHELSEGCLHAMASVANGIALGIERNRVTAELAEHAQKLQLADQRKDEFLAMLAHELRNPLAPIRSGLELMALESGESDTLTVMHNQVQHLTRLVDDLLDVSRIMRGRIELRREAVRLDGAIDHAVRTVQPAVESRDHSLSVKKCDELIWLSVDKVRLGQIVTNLLTNAAKYTPNGGQLEVEVQRVDDQAVITVRDNGVGIEAEFLPDVFELFSQAERGLARSEGGLGIGLTLVRRLVELHDGEVTVSSDGCGKGSEFVVRLPVAEPPAVPEHAEAEPEFTLHPDCRFLVVDDSMGSARILRRLLQAIGANEITMAHDGPAAVATAESFRPDVIFLDVGLPGLTGLQVVKKLRRSCT